MNEMKNIRLLEDRVTRAASRLRELNAEKRELEQELEQLREQLDAVPTDADAQAWMQERSEIVGSLQQTLAELREEV